MPSREATTSSETTILKTFVAVLVVISLFGVAMLQPTRFDGWLRLVLLGLLTGLASAWCVRIKGLNLELTPTDPFVLFAVATMGTGAAVVLAVVAVGGAAFWRGQRQRWACYLFNFTALPVSAALAGVTYEWMGGRANLPVMAMLGPLSLAAMVYLLVNTGSTATVIAVSRKSGFLRGWVRTFLWTLWPAVTSLTLAVCMVLLVESLGAMGLVLALPPVCALAGLQQADKNRFEQSRKTARADVTVVAA